MVVEYFGPRSITMSGPDLLLLHPPSIWDFRTRPRLCGPVSDLVPSSPVFEMYPIGFVTIADHLVRKGMKVRISNLAVQMLKSPRFDAERFIKRQNPKAFGIDLHWLPHAHGALEAARIAKLHHPEVPVILGGLSSSYYHEEIIKRYPFVDFIVRGDSTERALHELLEKIESDGDLSSVPNLTWRRGKKVKVNERMDVPKDLDHLSFDYDVIIKNIVRYRDITGHMPTLDWKTYPITALMTVRGCTQACVTCGGSCATYRGVHGRTLPAYRRPMDLVKDMVHISSILDGPIFLVGDLRQSGNSYADRVLKGIKNERINNEVVVELFWPASKDYLKQISSSMDRFNLSLSPESHDPKVRRSQGRSYDNASIERCIRESFSLGCQRFDLYFMIGLPFQGPKSPVRTVEYCGRIMDENKGKALHCYISPLAPFLDPGSLAFEDPLGHGYTLSAQSLEEHRVLLTQPSWKHALNYRTKWLDPNQLVDSTYEAASAMNDMKFKHGLLDDDEHEMVAAGIGSSIVAMARIDELVGLKDPKEIEAGLAEIKGTLDIAGRDILAGAHELEWPSKGIKYGKVLRRIISRK